MATGKELQVLTLARVKAARPHIGLRRKPMWPCPRPPRPRPTTAVQETLILAVGIQWRRRMTVNLGETG